MNTLHSFLKGKKVFIVAEAGVNHNGRLDTAKKMIQAASSAGADAVKFQAFRAHDLAGRHARKLSYQEKNTSVGKSQYEMLKKLEFSEKEFRSLSDYAKKKNIIFLSSVFDRYSADLMDKIGVAAFKIASGEINNLPLLDYVAAKRRPVILSSGMSDMKEISAALCCLRGRGLKGIILLHCVTDYPAKAEELNLRAMQSLRHKFKLPVGFSDHSAGITADIAAVALGACMIEKHFTLDRRLHGPDQRSSLEPPELKEMVETIRRTEKMLGNGVKQPTAGEKRNRSSIRRSIVAQADIPKGARITDEMVGIKRPEGGIEPKFLHRVIGKMAARRICRDSFIRRADLK